MALRNFIKRSITGLVVAASIFYVAFIGTLAYEWVYNTYNAPAEFKPVSWSQTVPQDGRFMSTWQVTRFRSCVSKFEYYFHDLQRNTLIRMGTTERYVEKTDPVTSRRDVDLPEQIEPGLYAYSGRLSYYCDLSNYIFGPIIMKPQPLYFTVVPKDSSPKPPK